MGNVRSSLPNFEDLLRKELSIPTNSTLKKKKVVPKPKSQKVFTKYKHNNKPSKPDLFLKLTHLNKSQPLYQVSFKQNWKHFIQNTVTVYLLDSATNFDYFVNGSVVSYNYDGSLSYKVKSGDTIIVRLKPSAPLPPKPAFADDAEYSSFKVIDFNENDEKEVNILHHKKDIDTKIIDSLLKVNDINKKLCSLIDIESYNDESSNDLNMDYKLHLDLCFDSEMKYPETFLSEMKQEISETLNVDIDCIHINSVTSGSVILEITIDEKGTTDVFQNNILKSNIFANWAINRCIKNKNIMDYYTDNNKNFNEHCPMWLFLQRKYGFNTYNKMKQSSLNKYNTMKTSHSSLIEPLSFNQIAAIFLYTTSYLYVELNKSLRDGTAEFSDYTIELVCGLCKLPSIWQKTYRGLGVGFTQHHAYIGRVYKKGTVVRWDGFSSTSLKHEVAKGFADVWGVEIQGFHGRNIKPFSAFPSEDEIIYMISSHFLISDEYMDGTQKWFRMKEMAFPWNNKAILWVDDKPTNNKSIIDGLERKGIMVIPRISTHEAIQFVEYMDKIFLSNDTFHKFRIISDMHRVEENEYGVTNDVKNAGALLVHELRNRGYQQRVCIYTSNKEKAQELCNAFTNITNVIITTSGSECEEFANY